MLFEAGNDISFDFLIRIKKWSIVVGPISPKQYPFVLGDAAENRPNSLCMIV